MKTLMILAALGFSLLTKVDAHTPYPMFDEDALAASARINNISTMHNVVKNGKKGMLIQLNFAIRGMRGRQCSAVAHFYYSSGFPLNNLGGGYGSKNGKVSTSNKFTPGYDKTNYDRLQLFIPYGEMHLNGSYDLKYRVSIFDCQGNGMIRSGYKTFKLTWKTNNSGNNSGYPKGGC